jgi:hypothetical protein
MKYTIQPSGRIDCDYVHCTERHNEGHSLHDIITGDTLTYKTNYSEYNCCIGCGKQFLNLETTMDLLTIHGSHSQCLVDIMTRMVTRFGMIDGAHHKQWLIDQMMQTIMGKEAYQTWLEKYNKESLESEYDLWDQGIAP